MRNKAFTMKFPAEQDMADIACTSIVEYCTKLGMDAEAASNIKTAAAEAINNAVCFAYSQPGKGHITVRLHCYKNNVLKISVKDEGKGIADGEKAIKPLYTTAKETHSGMGFSIMASFMDSVDVASKPGQGTTVTMTYWSHTRKV